AIQPDLQSGIRTARWLAAAEWPRSAATEQHDRFLGTRAERGRAGRFLIHEYQTESPGTSAGAFSLTGVYFKSWFAEGSRQRRGRKSPAVRGTTIGGVPPDRGRPDSSGRDSGAGIAFPELCEAESAKVTQHHPHANSSPSGVFYPVVGILSKLAAVGLSVV